jgi:DNA helicase-2/ATP-dependent DNA helicase PcrA
MAFLRLAENPRDTVAGTRVLLLLPGVGPKRARQWMSLPVRGPDGFQAWTQVKPPAACSEIWPRLVELFTRLHGDTDLDVSAQIGEVRELYEPLLEEKYENPGPRLRDVEQLEELALRFPDRATMLADLALDPPTSTEDLAGPALQDEDYLVLSTIHSAKGLEWSAVYVLHASDGNIPSDMATNTPEQIEEERRLFYVALTRAKRNLYVYFPQEYAHGRWGKYSDRHSFAQLTRFVTENVKDYLDCKVAGTSLGGQVHGNEDHFGSSGKVRSRSRRFWS